MGLPDALQVVRAGDRMSPESALALMRRGDPAVAGAAADAVREEMHGDRTHYRHDLNLNYTNACVNLCALCAFGIPSGDERAYIMDPDTVEKRVKTAFEKGVREFHVVGAVNPECGLEYVLDLFERVRSAAPGGFIHGMTAVEVDWLSRMEGMAVDDVLRILRDAGLGGMPGGGAEIFAPRVRRVICERKISGERWLEVHRIAHEIGIPTNATMLYGHIETPAERIDHMVRLRELQDETHGFRAFIPLAFNPENTRLVSAVARGVRGPSIRDTLLLCSTSRLFFDNIEHIKLVWQSVGRDTAQVALGFGVDDIGGSSFEERIIHAAGGDTFEVVGDRRWLPELIREAGWTPVETTSVYMG